MEHRGRTLMEYSKDSTSLMITLKQYVFSEPLGILMECRSPRSTYSMKLPARGKGDNGMLYVQTTLWFSRILKTGALASSIGKTCILWPKTLET